MMKTNIEKLSHIPAELKSYKQWILWKYEQRKLDGKPAKVPYQANRSKANITESSHFVSFDDALTAYKEGQDFFDGIGFVFTEHDPFLGIDIDDCCHNGALSEQSLNILNQLNSYTELSCSQKGVHAIIKGSLPGNKMRKGKYELYQEKRYFVFTGDILEEYGDEIQERQEELNKLYASIFMEEKIEVIRPDTMSKVNLQDKEIIELASKARNSNKFKSLYYDGATSDYSSASEADLALCSIIAYYTNSEEQIDRIFRSSALDRTKWDREDYRSRTIRKAIEGLANINSLDQKKPINSKLSTIADYLNDPEGFDKHMASQRGRKDIKTGFEQLDNTLGGGLYPGLYVLGAMSALGKTALCGQIADSIAINDNHTLFFSLEMSQYELICRSITRHLFLSDPRKYQTVNTNSIMNARFNDNDFSIIKSKYSQQIGQNYTIHHGNFNISTDTIRKIIQETVETCKKNLVVFVDYLQVINPAKPNMSDKQAVDQNITELKQMSRDFDIPIVVISSFNRSNYSTSVSFAAFKESGCIEYTADVVLGLQLEGAGEKDTDIGELLKKNPRRVELVILKNRRGKSNEKVSMSYYPAQNYFEEF